MGNIAVWDGLGSLNPSGVTIIEKVLGMLGISVRAKAGALESARNHWNTLENIVVWDGLGYLISNGVIIIEKVLVKNLAIKL